MFTLLRLPTRQGTPCHLIIQKVLYSWEKLDDKISKEGTQDNLG